MMASSLAKVVVPNKSLVLLRPVITSSSRFFNTNRLHDNDDSEDTNPTFIRKCSPPFIHDLMMIAHCPRLSVTGNLSRQLNLMDDQIGVKHAYHGYPRWCAGEYEDGEFTISRCMSGLYEEMKECAPTRDMPSLLHLTHFDTPCSNWDLMKDAKELDQFVQSTSGIHVLSSVRVFCTMRYIPAIYIIVGHEGPDPEDLYGGYVRKIYLPRRFYKIEYVNVKMSSDTLNITIPKRNNEKPIYQIAGNYIVFRERRSH